MARLATHALLALSLLCLAQGRAQAGAKPKAGAASGPAAKPRADYVEAAGIGHYKVHAERLTWREAQAACQAEGAHLLVLNSKKEAQAVADLLARTTPAPAPAPAPKPGAAPAAAPTAVSNELHAGFFLPDYFVTEYGSPLSTIGYQKWAPDQQLPQTCGSINHAALLFDAKCSDKRSFVCEWKRDAGAAYKLSDAPVLLPDASGPASPKYAPSKFEAAVPGYSALVQQGRTHYYRVSQSKSRWSLASRNCREEGGHLLVLNHQFEADTLKAHLQAAKVAGDVYVGLRNGPNKFVTVFGKTLLNAGYTTWESEQPEDETCLAVDQNMLLKKVPCWEERQYVCEITFL